MVKDYKSATEQYLALDIYRRRMHDKFWGLGEKTRCRNKIQEGDRVAFYSAHPQCSYVGTAVLASDCIQPSDEQQLKLRHNSAFHAQYGVWLESVDEFRNPLPMRPLIKFLKFVKKEEIWGNYLQGGIREIESCDFNLIAVGR